MFGSEMLDVAVGMIFIYLLLSLVCSAANELIERSAKHRATDLEKGLRELLNDPNGTDLVKKVYDHGMINGLFQGNYDPNSKDKSNLPSYIPSRNFALAVMGILVPDSPTVSSVGGFREAVGKIENARVKNALMAMLHNTGEDVSRFRDSIEAWFNSTMDRVSGWYKRRSQLIVFLLGYVAAAGMNVYSVSIANDLWVHKAQRDALVSAAQGYLVNHHVEAGQPGVDSGLTANIENMESYGLPVGWHVRWGQGGQWWTVFAVRSFFGWLITACAVSLGAPFWFDMLNKIIVVRSTIKPHEKSMEERSKD
jgi:hypothetical protein